MTEESTSWWLTDEDKALADAAKPAPESVKAPEPVKAEVPSAPVAPEPAK